MGSTVSSAMTAAPRQGPSDCRVCGGERVLDGVSYIDGAGVERQLTTCPVCSSGRVEVADVAAVDVRPGDVIDTAAGARLVDDVGRDHDKGLVLLTLAGAGHPVLRVGAGSELTVLARRDPHGTWSR